MKTLDKGSVTGLILAGGRARRMGGADKGLVRLGGTTLVAHVLRALQPQVGHLIINANRNIETYASFGCPVVADLMADYCGPLAGIASGMQKADTPYIVTAPCDSPFISDDLVPRLAMKLTETNAEISVAHDGVRMQPVFALLSCRLLPSLSDYLASGGRKIDTWYTHHRMAVADFSDCPETFVNINTPEEMQRTEERLAKA